MFFWLSIYLLLAIRENRREDFQVFNNSVEFAKISREGRAFPLKIAIICYCGEYDLVFSTKEKKPTLLFHKFKFTQDDRNISLSFKEIDSNWIYLGIYSKNFTHLIIEAKFSGLLK